MNHDLTHSAVVPIDRQGRIDADVVCMTCQYNLRTQPQDGHCPECGDPIADSLSSDHAALMPPFWLGQVWRGAVCLAVAWPLIPLCGFGLLFGLIGTMAICGDPPRAQFRGRGLRRMIAWSMTAAGVMLLAALLARETTLYLLPLAGLALSIALCLVGLHLFARRIARAARLDGFDWSSMTLACATLMLLLLFIVAMIAHDTIGYRRPLRGAVEMLWMMMYLFLVVYGLCQVIFWLCFAHYLKRVHDNALAVAQQRWAAGV